MREIRCSSSFLPFSFLCSFPRPILSARSQYLSDCPAPTTTLLLADGDNRTVFDDNQKDTMTGSAGQDWFFAKLVLDAGDDANRKDERSKQSGDESRALQSQR